MSDVAHPMRIVAIQEALGDMGTLDGWLFYDFADSDPLAYRVLLLDPTQHVTRRWYYWIPTSGEPVKLLHRIEPHVLDEFQVRSSRMSHGNSNICYWPLCCEVDGESLCSTLRSTLFHLSRVDAGTVELIRSCGPDVVSSADLVQRFEAVWTDDQLESHRYAVTMLRNIVDEAFAHVASCLTNERSLSEYGLQQFILSRIRDAGMTTSHAPIAAIDAHSADPHYGPTDHALPSSCETTWF